MVSQPPEVSNNSFFTGLFVGTVATPAFKTLVMTLQHTATRCILRDGLYSECVVHFSARVHEGPG